MSGRIQRKGLAWPVWLGIGIVLLLVGYPLAILALQSVFPNALAGRFDDFLMPYARIFTTEGVAGMLWNSVRWAIAVTILSWIAGIPCGWLLARTNLAAKGLARILLVVPIMTPPYIAAISYVLIMQPGGFWDSALGGMPDVLRYGFFSFWGITLVMAMMSFGVVALAVEAALLAIPNRMEDAAAGLGSGRMRTAFFIMLPLLTPAILNSGLLVFLECLSNFGVPVILGPRVNLPLLPAEIYNLVTSWPVDLPLATSLSSLLCLLALGAIILSQRLVARLQLASARAPSVRLAKLGAGGQWMAWAWITVLVFLSVLLPYSAMVMTSFVDRWNDGLPEFTLRHYGAIFTPGSTGLQALGTSLWLSIATATICCLIGGFIAYVLSRFPGTITRVLDALSLLPRVLPKIVTVVGIILAWNAPWVGIPIYNTIWILLLAYVALLMSDALRFSDTTLRQISTRLEQAAALLGASRGRIFVSIVLPLLRPALLAAWITTFLVSMRELVASLILLPPGVETTATYVFNQFEQGDIASAMAMATFTILLSTAVLVLMRIRVRKS